MKEPPIWTGAQLDADRIKSSAGFIKERLEEPLEDYLEAYDEYQGVVEELLELTVDLTQIDTAALDILTDSRMLEAWRYLGAPPISLDDYKVLADAPSLSRPNLEADPETVERLVGVVRQVMDRRRFAWVSEKRAPTEAEKQAAIMGSSALMAASRTQTGRRNKGKDRQEAAVKAALTAMGFKEVPTRTIETISQSPAPGEFCGECKLGSRKGDIIVRLWDERVMPIECKVSNSATNSVKRLNNDAAVKATSWKHDFGVRQVVPTGLLSGVYKLHNLEDAQNRGLTLFWAHDLQKLTDWIDSTKP